MITATKNGITRNFSDEQWRNMPKDKYGWQVISEQGEPAVISDSIVQKKIMAGQVVTAEKIVPEEIVTTSKVESIEKEPEDLPEIKKRGRKSK